MPPKIVIAIILLVTAALTAWANEPQPAAKKATNTNDETMCFTASDFRISRPREGSIA